MRAGVGTIAVFTALMAQMDMVGIAGTSSQLTCLDYIGMRTGPSGVIFLGRASILDLRGTMKQGLYVNYYHYSLRPLFNRQIPARVKYYRVCNHGGWWAGGAGGLAVVYAVEEEGLRCD